MAAASLNLSRQSLFNLSGSERASEFPSYDGSARLSGRRFSGHGAVSFVDKYSPSMNRKDCASLTFSIKFSNIDSRLSRNRRKIWWLSFNRQGHSRIRIFSSYEEDGLKVEKESGRIGALSPDLTRSWEERLSGDVIGALAEGERLIDICGLRDNVKIVDGRQETPAAAVAIRDLCLESSNSSDLCLESSNSSVGLDLPDQTVQDRLSSNNDRKNESGEGLSVDGKRQEYDGEAHVRQEGSNSAVSSSASAEVSDVSAARLKAELEDSRRKKSVQASWEALLRWSKWSMQKLSNAARDDHVLLNTRKVVVLGGGSFGTAMAVMLARNKPEMDVVLLLRDQTVCETINDVHINRKYFPKHTLPENVRATTCPSEAITGAQFAIHAVPVQQSTKFLMGIAPHVPPTLPIMSVSKGLEVSTLEMMSQVIPRALGNPRQPVAVLSGPSFSIELMDKLPTALVAASRDAKLARAAQQLLASPYLRVNTSSDVVGVEMAGALKNVLAIAAGIVEGMSLGNNCMAALVAQGCSEIRWLAEKMGAKPATLAGLSGTGDIMLTCFVKLSRNRSVGVRLGSGERLEDILASMNQVAEGVATAGAVIALARKYRVSIPVLTAVARILDNELTPKAAVMELMSLPQVAEV